MSISPARSVGAWPNLAASAVWWAYDRAPAGCDGLLDASRRYLAPLLQPLLPVRRHVLALDADGSLLACGNSMTLDYVGRALGPVIASSAPLPSAWLGGTTRRLRRGCGPGEMMAASMPRMLSGLVGERCLRIPSLVSLGLPLRDGLDDSLVRATTTVRRDARRVIEAGTSWSMTHDVNELELFYREFYTPAVRARFGELAVVRELAMLRRQFRLGGGLIWLEHAGRRIAGTVVQLRGRTLHGLVAAADPMVRYDGRAGPLFAVKIAALDVAIRMGAGRLDMGGTVPALRDGSLQAKRAFGAELQRAADCHRDLLLGWRAGAPAIRHLLHLVPLVFEAPRGLCGIAAAAPGTAADASLGCRLWRQLAPAGLQRLFVLGASGWSRHAGDGTPAPAGPIVLCPDVDAASINRAAAAPD